MHVISRRLTTVSLLGCLLLLFVGVGTATGCRPESPQVTVKICGDAKVPQQIDALRISLLDEERKSMREGVMELLVCPEAKVKRFPQTIKFPPFSGDAWGVVQGLKDGTEILQYERQLDLNHEESTRLQLAVNADCIGIDCPLGQTCVRGDCVVAPHKGDEPTVCESGSSSGTMGFDAGMQGGMKSTNGSMSDAGMSTSDVGFNPKSLCPNADTGSMSGGEDDTGS